MRSDLEIPAQNEELSRNISKVIFLLIAATGPYLLLLVRLPSVVALIGEEVWKGATAMAPVRNTTRKPSLSFACAAGLLFGISEFSFYAFDAFATQSFNFLILRFLLTVPMHALTTILLVSIGRRGGMWWIVGLAAAAATHAVFNIVVG